MRQRMPRRCQRHCIGGAKPDHRPFDGDMARRGDHRLQPRRKGMSECLEIYVAPVQPLQFKLAPTAGNLSLEVGVVTHRIGDEPRGERSVHGVLFTDPSSWLSLRAIDVGDPASQHPLQHVVFGHTQDRRELGRCDHPLREIEVLHRPRVFQNQEELIMGLRRSGRGSRAVAEAALWTMRRLSAEGSSHVMKAASQPPSLSGRRATASAASQTPTLYVHGASGAGRLFGEYEMPERTPLGTLNLLARP